jgi:hypothetical protein
MILLSPAVQTTEHLDRSTPQNSSISPVTSQVHTVSPGTRAFQGGIADGEMLVST